MSTPRRHPVLSASTRAARSFAGRLPAAGPLIASTLAEAVTGRVVLCERWRP